MAAVYTVLGTGNPDFTGDGGPANVAECSYPNGVAVTPSGDIYVAEWGNICIRKIDGVTGVASTFVGQAAFHGSPTIERVLGGPLAIAVHPVTGLIYFVDANDGSRCVVLRINGDNTITTIAGPGPGVVGPGMGVEGDGGPATSAWIGSNVTQLAFNSDGSLLYLSCTDRQAVRRINLNTGIITRVVGIVDNDAGYLGGSVEPPPGDGGLATAALTMFPVGLALDSADNLYFAESTRGVIRRVDADTGIITTIFGYSGFGYPYSSTTGDGGPAADATAAELYGLDIDEDDNIWFGDRFCVRRIDAVTGVVTREIGQPDDPDNANQNIDGQDSLLVGIEYPETVLATPAAIYYTRINNHLVRRMPIVAPVVCCNGTAGELISDVRAMLNDEVAPYRYSDTAMLQWLSDGQRLIAQLVSEAYPVTEVFTPVSGQVRQRLDPAAAYGLIRVEQNYSGTEYGTAIRLTGRDVYDTFDPQWMARAPATTPAAGTYFDGYCIDPDDPLGFFLHPKPTNTANKVVVTYIAAPPELTALSDCVSLSRIYHDALHNYIMYRAASVQLPGFSPAAAAAAIERFGEQLNVSRDTIVGLIGEPHRMKEQQL